MSQLAEQNLNEIQMAGGYYTAKPIVSTGTVTLSGTVTLPAQTVTGANTTQKAFFNSVAVNTNGTTAVNFFPTGSTAPTAGTLTGIKIEAPDATKGTIDLISDQGTLVRLIKGGTANAYTGSFITPIAFLAGSLLKVISQGSDNACVEAIYYTLA